MSGSKRRRPANRPAPREPEVEVVDAAEDERPPRRGLFGGSLLGGSLLGGGARSGESALPPMGRSVGRGLLAVAAQPALVLIAMVVVAATWLALVGIGFEGVPGRLVDVLALPPISTYFDLGTGASLYGIGPPFLIYLGVSIVLRTLVTAALTGLVLEALEDGRVSLYGLLRGVAAIPTVLVVLIASFSLIVAGNLILPVLGPGIGFLGFVAALVGGLFFLGFAPTAAIREGRPVMETIRRSARAAMLPGGRHLILCSLYFFLALPVVLGFAPGGGEITANPGLGTWVFVLLVNVVHVGFMAAFTYRWVVAEPEVPNEPVRRRRPPARAGSGRSRPVRAGSRRR